MGRKRALWHVCLLYFFGLLIVFSDLWNLFVFVNHTKKFSNEREKERFKEKSSYPKRPIGVGRPKRSLRHMACAWKRIN